MPDFIAHHGQCIGADQDIHQLCFWLDVPIIIHPPTDDKLTFAAGASALASTWRLPAPYLERNKQMIQECDLLLAFPKEDAEVNRSGTWATIRYAKKERIPVTVYLPKGRVLRVGGRLS